MKTFQPDGMHSVTPRIITRDVKGQVEFLKTVFGASGEIQGDRPVDVQIGDSVIMVSDGGGMREMYRAFLYVYVEDTDEAYKRALAAGATSVEAPSDMPYGDRRATVRDAWDNLWQIATHKS